jgi:hypothetical protein
VLCLYAGSLPARDLCLTVGAYFDQALGQRVSKSSSSTHHGRGARVIFLQRAATLVRARPAGRAEILRARACGKKLACPGGRIAESAPTVHGSGGLLERTTVERPGRAQSGCATRKYSTTTCWGTIRRSRPGPLALDDDHDEAPYLLESKRTGAWSLIDRLRYSGARWRVCSRCSPC